MGGSTAVRCGWDWYGLLELNSSLWFSARVIYVVTVVNEHSIKYHWVRRPNNHHLAPKCYPILSEIETQLDLQMVSFSSRG